MAKLTNKQRVFINEYLKCWNATESARRAGYAFPNVEGPKNLVKPSIAEIVKARIDELTMSADEALVELTAIARSDMADFLKFEKGVKAPFLDLAGAAEKGLLKLVKKFKYNTNGLPEIELYDKQAAIIQMGKAKGAFKDMATNLNIDLSQLSNEQLERIANGEDPVNVLASQSEG